jgi:hypothetical protein
MPHTLNWGDGGLFRTFTGTVTGTEIIDSNLMMHGDRRFDDIKYVVNNFSEMEDCLISEEELIILKTVDDVAALTNKDLKIAIIMTNEAFIPLARFYCEAMREAAYEADLFANLNEAHQWAKQREISGI